MGLKLGRFGKYIRNTLEVLKCGAGQGLEIRWTDRVKSEEALYTIKDDKNIIRKIKRRLNGLVTSCVGSAFEKALMKGR
jgi:hypothetical protein